jgi:formyl-CoA transferase
MTALLEREKSGEGQWVQSSLLQAGIQLLDFQAARYTMSGEVAERVGNDHPTSMPTSAYRTADGYMNVAASGKAMWQRLCEAIGRTELFRHPDYLDAESRSRNRAALNAELNRAFAARPTAEWIEVLNRAGVPCGPIYAMDQVFADPQVRHAQAVAEVAHARLGKLRLVNQPVKLSRTPARVASASPERGEHTEAVLRELGYDEAAIAQLREERVI